MIRAMRKAITLTTVFFLFGLCAMAEGSRTMTPDEVEGRKYFEGANAFAKGGPSCISCHSVQNNKVAKGGLFAKDLTDVYSRMGDGIAVWLSAPSFPAMASSYQNHPLTETERNKLTAFLKYSDEVKASGKNYDDGQLEMLAIGGAGLISILVLISLIWFKQKRKMVKQEIFDRQAKAWDAKF